MRCLRAGLFALPVLAAAFAPPSFLPPVPAQEPTITVSKSAPTTQPAEPLPADAVMMTAVVVKVAGNVRMAPVVDAGQPIEWRPVSVGDRLPPGTQVRTSLRSSLLLQFGDSTIVKIDRATNATVSQFYRTAQQQRVKLDLGYGAVRAGVASGTLESDMTVETPVATLTRRGTWNFGIEYEAVTGRFRIFIEEHGLIEALNQLTNERRSLSSGEYLTYAMIRWIEAFKFDREIFVLDEFGLRGQESLAAHMNGSGRSILLPGGSPVLFGPRATLNAPSGRQAFGPILPVVGPVPPTPPLGVVDRPEGNFGTGGAILPKLPFESRARRR